MKFIKYLRNNIWILIFTASLLILVTIIINLLYVLQGKEPERADIAGAVLIGSVDDGGWNENHYKGLKAACDAYKIPLVIEENVSEAHDDCKKAIESLVKQGANIIFLTSDGFGSGIFDIIRSYPDVFFYTISPESDPSNCTTYYCRMYQMRYLSGIIAGKMTRTNVFGFVAAKNNPQINRGANAFFLGAKSVNPNVTMKVRLIDSWRDPEKEIKAAEELITKDNADVITSHTSEGNTTKVAEKHRVYSIGYNINPLGHSRYFLANLVFRWETLYRSILVDHIKGISTQETYGWDFSQKAMDIDILSSLVSADIVKDVHKAHSGFSTGKDVFMGLLKDNKGKVRCKKNERIGDDYLFYDMDWFLEGVEVYEE